MPAFGAHFMIRKSLFFLAKWIVLTLHNIAGRNKHRTDRFIRDEYSEQINDWENYESNDTSQGIRANKFEYLTDKEKRDAYIRLLSEEIKEHHTVLEAGCGGGVNIMVLKQQYPEKEFLGFDFLQGRVGSALKIAKQKQLDIRFFRSDLRNISLENKSVDIAYTVLALEQLPGHTRKALNELIRVATHKIVLIEPCYDFGNYAQKQYVIYKDLTRTLKQDLETLEREGRIRVRKAMKLPSLHNPLNPASLFVLDVPALERKSG